MATPRGVSVRYIINELESYKINPSEMNYLTAVTAKKNVRFSCGSCSASVWHTLYRDLLIVLVMLHVKQMGQNGGNSGVLVCLT